ncbi:SDR family NAD(P)-dependent oxidoreductase [Paenibacillus sp. TH7-28]
MELELPEEAERGEGYAYAPGMVDGALQALIGVMASDPGSGEGKAYLPFFTEEVKFLHRLPRRCIGHIRFTGSLDDGGILRSDIGILDQEGRELILVRGFCVRAAGKKQSELEMRDWCFMPDWRESPLPKRDFPRTAPLHVFMKHEPEHERLVASLEERGYDVIRVYPGESFVSPDAGSAARYEVNPGLEDNYIRLWALEEERLGNLEQLRIIHLWTLGGEEENGTSLSQLQECCDKGLYSLTRLIRGVGRLRSAKAEIYVLTCNSQPFAGSSRFSPGNALLTGPVQAANLEYPLLQCRMIDTDFLEINGHMLCNILLNEMASGEDVLSVYRKGTRWRKSLTPLEEASSVYSELLFRTNGVYLITGGLGGIGLEAARYLAARHRVKLVLLGRNIPGDQPNWRLWDEFGSGTQTWMGKKRILEEISDCGSEILILRADVADPAAMEAVREQIAEKFGKVNGIIHAAGVLKDALLCNLDADTWQTVLRPKTAGTLVLDQVFAKDRPDFMVLFSGAMSQFANAGQANHISANAFEDAYGYYRQNVLNQRTLVINWWFWGESGVIAKPFYMDILKNKGLRPLSNAEGMRAFEEATRSGGVQVVVADPQTVKAMATVANTGDLRGMQAIADLIHSRLPKLLPSSETERTARFVEVMDKLCGIYAMDIFRQLGLFAAPEESLDLDDVMARGGIRTEHRHLTARLLKFAANERLLNESGGRYRLYRHANIDDADPSSAYRRGVGQFPENEAAFAFLAQCYRHYPRLLTGQLHAMNVLFPKNGSPGVEQYYRELRVAYPYAEIAKEVILAVMEEQAGRKGRVKVLEIGAGTGSTTVTLLPEAADRGIVERYDFTDISPVLVNKASKKLTHYPFVNYRVLDIEKPIEKQDFLAGSYDVAVAANVLHATSDLDAALRNARGVLKPGGAFILFENTLDTRYHDFIFGMTSGWWNYTAGLDSRSNSPLLSPEGWKKALGSAGFEGVEVFPPEGKIKHHFSVIVASAGRGARETAENKAGPAVLKPYLAGKIAEASGLIVKEESFGKAFLDIGLDSLALVGLSRSLEEELNISLYPTVFFEYNTLDKLTGYLEHEFGKTLCLPESRPVQEERDWKIEGNPAHQPEARERPASPGPSMNKLKEYAAGLIGNLAGRPLETKEHDVAFLDLGLDSLSLIELAGRMEKDLGVELYPTVFFEYNTVTKLCGYLRDNFTETELFVPKGEDREKAPRVEASSAGSVFEDFHAAVPENAPQPDSAEPGQEEMAGVFVERSGSPDGVGIRRVPVPEPGPGEVRIRVTAAGLNFSDVMTVMGNYPNALDYPHILGSELSGVIDKTGPGVSRSLIGREVAAITNGSGAFAEYAVVAEDAAITIGPCCSHDAAATFPIVYLTCRQALHRLGQMEEGETLLIKSAAGGIGLMAVQMAAKAGVNIIGTVGSREKAEYLNRLGVSQVINYREEDYAAAVRRLTGGRGVDLILSSSRGDELEKDFSLLAPGGRFLEIGMGGIRKTDGIALTGFSENQSLFGIDLRRLNPAVIRKHLINLEEQMFTGEIEPIRFTAYDYRDFREAFRHLSSGRSIGKVVLTFYGKHGEPLTINDQEEESDESGSRSNLGDIPHFDALEVPVSADHLREPEKARISHGEALEIAIIGIAGRLPGASDLDEYWANLASGTDSVGLVPVGRTRLIGCAGQDMTGGFIEDADRFDSLYFNISPAEAVAMDPQQRLFLTVAHEAVEDAGYGGSCMLDRSTGVFVGVSRQDYLDVAGDFPQQSKSYLVTGNTHSVLASRISYFLDLKGPAIAVDTACSSSLSALHLACESIRSGQCGMALAGGVNLILNPKGADAFRSMRALSKQGRCKAFDRDADGFVSSEGAGAFVLKPLGRALADGDHIYAVIKGSAANNDGFSNGITAPNSSAQTEVIRRAMEHALVSPETVSYVETHGTGTLLGDPIEVEGLAKVFSAVRPSSCAIGSVKTNIGHAETAAGVAGLLKIILSFKHGFLPPTIHLRRENPLLRLEHSPFYVNDRLIPWNKGDSGEPRRAGISSFGFSGTNVHVILEEAPEIPLLKPSAEHETLPCIFTMSAASPEVLEVLGDRYKHWLERRRGLRIQDICHAANTGKRSMKSRTAFLVSSMADLAERLERLKTHLLETEQSVYKRPDGKTVLYFGDIGASGQPETVWTGLGLPGGKQSKALLNRLIKAVSEIPLSPSVNWLARQYLYAEWLKLMGVVPDLVIGEGLGRYTALAVSGALPLEAALRRACSGEEPLAGVVCPEVPVAVIQEGKGQPMEITDIRVSDKLLIKELLDEVQIRHLIRIGSAEGQACSDWDFGNGNLDSAVPVSANPTEDRKALLETLCSVYRSGCDIHWDIYYADTNIRKIPLPGYPYEPKSHWAAPKGDMKETLEQEEIASGELYRWNWFPVKEAELPDASAPLPGTWIVFADDQGVGDVLGRKLARAGATVVRVREGDASIKISDTEFFLNSRDEQGYIMLGDAIRNCGSLPPVTGIAHLWSLSAVNGDGGGERWEETENRFYSGLYSVFFLVQSLLVPKLQTPLRLILATSNAHSTGMETSPLSFHQQPMAVFARTFAREVRKLAVSTVDFEAGIQDTSETAKHIYREICGGTETDICIRGGKRLAKQLMPFSSANGKEIFVKLGGVYVITGGTSGVGLQIAGHLSSKFGACVILLGRKANPSAEVARKIARINEEGGQIRYICADVTDEQGLAGALEMIRTRHGAIKGVFHCAGITEDGLVEGKSFESLKRVCEPKIKGTLLLHRLLMRDQIDFIMLFSSISSIFCNPGQADYAAANAFMNSFAEYAHNQYGTRILSVSWPYWEGTGMRQNERVRRQLSHLGFKPLRGASGVALLERLLQMATVCATPVVLSYSGTQINSLLPGAWDERTAAIQPTLLPNNIQFSEENESAYMIRALNMAQQAEMPGPGGKENLLNEPVTSEIAPPRENSPSEGADEDWEAATTRAVQEVIAELLILDSSQVDPDRSFSEYGMDSMLIKEAMMAFERRFNFPVSSSWFMEYDTVRKLGAYLSTRTMAERLEGLSQENGGAASALSDKPTTTLCCSNSWMATGQREESDVISILEEMKSGGMDMNAASQAILDWLR